MKILWMNWKDLKNPLAGGAEVVTEELAKRLAADGHEITLLVAGFPGAPSEESLDGYRIIRVGKRFTVYWHAWRYYKKNLKGKYDLVIDEMNTLPFFAHFYAKEPVILFVHQLAREIWFYETPFPVSVIGYVLEVIYLRILGLVSKKILTISESSRRDLIKHGFKPEHIFIIGEGIQIRPVEDIDSSRKYEKPTILSLGRVGPMKRIDHIIKTFEIAKNDIPELELVIAGATEGSEGKKMKGLIESSPFAGSIRYVGRVSPEKKVELMQKSHVLAVASVKEGWCLVVTEMASQGTPSVGYNIDGLRDSIKDGVTGYTTNRNTPSELAALVTKLLRDNEGYARIRREAWRWSKEITFENCYSAFVDAIKERE